MAPKLAIGVGVAAIFIGVILMILVCVGVLFGESEK